jgi:hypothetical protein
MQTSQYNSAIESSVRMRKRIAGTRASIPRRAIHVPGAHDITLTSPPKDPAYWRCLKPINTFAEFSIQISSVVVVHKLRLICEHYYSRGLGRYLIAVVYLGLCTATFCWWWLPQNSIPKHFVQHRRANTLPMSCNCFVNDPVNLTNSLSGSCRNKQNWSPPYRGQLLANISIRNLERKRARVSTD